MNLLGDADDRALARHAVRSSVQMLAPHTSAVRDRNGDVVDPGWSDAEIDAWLRACARDTSHLTGGARMGDADEDAHRRRPSAAGARHRRPHGRRPVGVPDRPAREHLPHGGDDRRARGRLHPRRMTACRVRSARRAGVRSVHVRRGRVADAAQRVEHVVAMPVRGLQRLGLVARDHGLRRPARTRASSPPAGPAAGTGTS